MCKKPFTSLENNNNNNNNSNDNNTNSSLVMEI